MSAIRNLLNQIVDYAGLFPPAGLPLDAVVKNYAQYVSIESSWMLGRLIVPSNRLAEFSGTSKELFPNGLDQPRWKISALIPPVNADDGAFAKSMDAIASFNENQALAQVDTVEGKLPTADLVADTCNGLTDSLHAFLEIPHEDPDEMIHQLAAAERTNTYAKIRTGGVTPDLIPASERVANFLFQCAQANLGFKATAGLHHPFRGVYPLTYEKDSKSGTMHGFINVFLAACVARKNDGSVQQLTSLLEQTDPAVFFVSHQQIEYQDHVVSASDIESVREDFAISFGSCSFTEPADDLIQAGWLADTAKTV